MGHWENEEEQDGPVREKGISEVLEGRRDGQSVGQGDGQIVEWIAYG